LLTNLQWVKTYLTTLIKNCENTENCKNIGNNSSLSTDVQYKLTCRHISLPTLAQLLSCLLLY